MDFTKRSTVDEQLDDPNLDKASFQKAFLDINRCNTLLGGTAITINALKKLMKEHPKKSYTILDMGCGDGHMLREIAKAFEHQPIELKLIGLDLRQDIITLAEEASKNFKTIRFQTSDIMDLNQVQPCDIVLCTLTMHHFNNDEIKKFGTRFGELAKIGVVINDLQRSKLAYYLFTLFSVFFIKSKIAKDDGLISIRKGFRKIELQRLSKSISGLEHIITWKWAFRYLWIMKPMQTK